MPKAPPPWMRPDESDLVARLRAGEDAAFEEVVREHGPALLVVTRRFLRNEEDARDAVQDAFLSAFKAIGGFAQGARLSTWLHRIAVNAALMKLRAKRSRPEELLDDLLPRFQADGHFAEAVAAWQETTDADLQREETRRRVRGTIDRLPETYRTVLLLRDIEELDTEESARVLGITPNAVKVRLHRAHQALRTLLDRESRKATA